MSNKRITDIEARNRRVELDKAWETSWTRRISIAVLTYFVITVYLAALGNQKPYLHALVPSIGFMLSTLVLPGIRAVWQKNRQK